MPLLTTAAADRATLALAIAEDKLVVMVLCAAWCDTCREFRETTQRLADASPDVPFVWLDIEDDEALAGEVDVENFPTLAITRGATVLHFGVSLPHEGGVARLVDAMRGRDQPAPAVPDAVHAMIRALRRTTPRSGD